MFGRKRRAQKEAAAKTEANAELRAALVDLIGIAEGETRDPQDWPLVLKPGERLVYVMSGGGLFEPRRESGHWTGRSAGFSVPVTDGIRFRVGKSAGTYVQGQEKPTIIDTGGISFTTQRVVFQGGKYTREWQFSKLIGIVHDTAQASTAIQVSNREKTSGIVYTGLSPDLVRLKLAVAVAIFNGEAAEAASELRERLNELDATVPAPGPSSALPRPTDPGPPDPGSPDPGSSGPGPPDPESSGPGSPGPGPSPDERAPTVGTTATPAASVADGRPSLPPPMWAADPSGRHQLRYWNGVSWTGYVSDNGHEFQEAPPAG
jgi:Protein of unknown function (DUF2510)